MIGLTVPTEVHYIIKRVLLQAQNVDFIHLVNYANLLIKSKYFLKNFLF